jgi:deoxyribose-phosphate aldolase
VPTRAEVARIVDFTLLRPEATRDDVAALCGQAAGLGVGAICVSPSFLPLPAGLLAEHIRVCTVVGFPSGAHQPPVKAAEAARAADDGADELDMVVNLGAVRSDQWRAVARDIAAVRDAAPDVVLKVILETAALRELEIVRSCIVAQEAGANYVKTSTGFHPAGGATRHAVSLMASTVGGSLGIKASGGIRTATDALAMLAAGATRLGLSDPRLVLDGLEVSAPPELPTARQSPA